MKHGLLATLTVALLGGCDGNSEAPSPPAAKAESAPAPAKAEAAKTEATPEAKDALAAPKKAKKTGPPESFEALAAGSSAPAMTKLAATTGAWSRADKPTIVAFYRGHW